MDKCHFLLFGKDGQVELAQESSRTCSVSHTRASTSLNLSITPGDMSYSPHFSDEDTEAYRTNK